MKQISKYIAGMVAGAAILAGASSCDDNFARPPMIWPTTTMEANTTILDFKTAYWSSEKNYVEYPGTFNEEGEHIFIRGRVVSSNESGNIYNNIVIQDSTAALTIAVRTNGMETVPLFGQMIVVDVTGLAVGGYNGLMQLGAEGTYNGQPSMTFMEGATLDERYGLDGGPNAALVDTAVVTIPELNNLKTTEGLIAWQSRIVRIENVKFDNAGQEFNNTTGTISLYAKDSTGASVILRISNYSNFAHDLIPAGTGNVTGILSYYGSDWQILPIDAQSFQGFDTSVKPDEPENPDTPDNPDGPALLGDGTEDSPYSVAQVLNGTSGTEVWTAGYIVGSVTDLGYDSSVIGTDNASNTNIIIADTPTETNYENCIPVQLPAGAVRNALSLQQHPGNLGKKVLLLGNLEKYFGVPGVKSVTDYKLDGSGTPDTPAEPAEPVSSIDENFESGELPSTWKQYQVAGNKSWYVTSYQNNYYASMTGYKGNAPFDQWLVTCPIDANALTEKSLIFDTEQNGYGSTTSVFEVYVLDGPDPSTAKTTKLNPALPAAPASGYSDWMSSGSLDLSSYTGIIYIGFRYAATPDDNYATWCLDNVIVK